MDKLTEILKAHRIHVAYGGALLALSAAGWVSGSQYGTVPDNRAQGARELALPSWSPVNLDAQREKAISIAAFEPDPDELAALAKTTEPVLVEPEEQDQSPTTAWRFIGTVRQGDLTYAVLLVSKPVALAMRSMSEPLPNDERLVSIGSDRITYEDETGQHELKLFEQAIPATKEIQ